MSEPPPPASVAAASAPEDSPPDTPTPLLSKGSAQWLAAWNLSNEGLPSSQVNPPGLPLTNS